MANHEHVAILKQGVDAWNAWRRENPDIRPDLREADLSDADLSDADLHRADLHRADLHRADLSEADLSRTNLADADLSEAILINARLSAAKLHRADLSNTDLSNTDLRDANLSAADLIDADLSGLRGANLSAAKLHRADLQGAILIGADFSGADLTGCRIHGVSAWRLKIEGIKQQNLVITRADEPTVTVDNIEVAQFVYLLLHNEKIRDIIDTIGKKGVLLLGRFTEGRMAVLERLKEKLRDLGFVPMVFNFDKPETKDFTETVRLLCKPVPLRDCRHYQPPVGTSRTASDGAGLYGPRSPPSFSRGSNRSQCSLTFRTSTTGYSNP